MAALKGTYWQRGESLDYTNAGDTTIEAGTVITYGDRIGIAGCDIAPGEMGSIHVEGVFAMPKKDETAIDAGAQLYWAEGQGVTTTSGGTKAGFAAQAAAASDTTILVKINA